MHLKKVAQRAINTFRHPSVKTLILLAIGAFLLVTYAIIVVVHKPVSFSYAGATCVGHLTILPGAHKVAADNSEFAVSYQDELRIGDMTIAALKTCFEAQSAPVPGNQNVTIGLLGSRLAAKTYAVHTPAHPVVNADVFAKPVPVSEPLLIGLSTPDSIFDYEIRTKDKHVTCPVGQQGALSCDLASMKLRQGELYDIELIRSFNDTASSTIVSREIRTVRPVVAKKLPIKKNQVIYNQPKSFSVKFNKAIDSAQLQLTRVMKDGKKSTVPVTLAVAGDTLSVAFKDKLARESSYSFTLQAVKAKDGSGLTQAIRIPFKTSGGPRVLRASIGSYDVDRNASITLTLDQSLKPGQSVSSFVSFSGGRATISGSGKLITIRPQGMARCKPFSIQVKKGLKSRHDITSTHNWSFASRTRCRTVSTIGYSVNGRPIVASYFGSGSRTYLFTGAIHGNELSSKYIMDSWVRELEANPGKIPSQARIVVVPAVNPDGASFGSRPNARGVNLNRNFPTDNWKSNIETGSGPIDKGGGGKSPLSEPESRALANLVQSLRPYLTITYHSSGSIVNTNEVGVDITLGKQYANTVGYQFVWNAQVAGTFGFEMTGTLEKWMHEELNMPGILIELSGDYGYYFQQHRGAMWALMR